MPGLVIVDQHSSSDGYCSESLEPCYIISRQGVIFTNTRWVKALDQILTPVFYTIKIGQYVVWVEFYHISKNWFIYVESKGKLYLVS